MISNSIKQRSHLPVIPAKAGIQSNSVIPAQAGIQPLRWSSAFRLFGAGLPTPPKRPTEGLRLLSVFSPRPVIPAQPGIHMPVIPAKAGIQQLSSSEPRNHPASDDVLAPDLSNGAAGHAPASALYSRPLEFTPGTVFTNGCFDIFHAGHVNFLRQCRQLGKRLIVGINCDQTVRALKGPTRPICTLAERAAVVASCRYVNEVHAFHEPTPCELIRRLRPEIIVKGPGYSPENMPEAAIITEWGGQVIILDGPAISTTGIVQRICRSQFAETVNDESDVHPG